VSARAAALVAALGATLLGCPKGNESSPGPAPRADAPTEAAAPLDLEGPECTALRDRVAALATAARKCTPKSATACQRCVIGHLFHCGIFVGDESSPATRDYLAARAELVAKSCMKPVTTSPPCSPEPTGTCAADGACGPAWCNVPATKTP
jgi:hypothetical protein